MKPSNPPCHKATAWLGFVTLSIGIGALWGKILGVGLALFSYDYPVDLAEHIDWGIRFGFLVGSVLAACQIVGQRPMAGLPQALLGFMLTWGITVLGTAAIAGIAYHTYNTGIWNPATWQLPNPSRHAWLMGALIGRNYGAVLGLGIGAIAVWRSRRK